MSDIDYGTVGVLGIDSESKSRWERRCPLAPEDVKALVAQGVKVLVTPSTLRVFSNEDFENAGAVITKDLSPCRCIIGVKERKIEELIPNRTYCFFSHTIKAQSYNMGLLDAIIEKNVRLLDYECIRDDQGHRLVRFGKFAGIAGFVDMMRALGNRLLYLGYSTPFLHCGYSHMYANSDGARDALSGLGQEIKTNGLPAAISPMIFLFTGADGNVASGALEMFEHLPHKYISVSELAAVSSRKQDSDRFIVYGCKVTSADCNVRKDGKPFDKKDYYANPSEYESVFAKKIAPYVSVIVNNTYWDSKFPRFLTVSQFRQMWRKKNSRLLGVCDISADPMGSIEMMQKCTTIDSPVFIYDPETNSVYDSIEGKGVLFLAVDNLPTELPIEASRYFSKSLLPYLKDLAFSDPSLPHEKTDLPRQIAQAVITSHKALTPSFQYITKIRQDFESNLRHVLVIGSGYVAAPAIEYLLHNDSVRITVASFELEQAQKLVRDKAAATAVFLDVSDEDAVDALVARHELILSLVPAPLHPGIARFCIKHKRHLVTASYISPELRAMNQEAEDAGIIMLNEIGLDPGIDHMSALEMIDKVRSSGGHIVSFKSMCGALAAPDSANNPFHYKFSWSPQGVLRAGLNPAQYRRDGKTVNIPGDRLFHSAEEVKVDPCFAMELLPNRDSLIYCEPYGLEDCETMMRCTLRYPGFSLLMRCLLRCGFFDQTPFEESKEEKSDEPRCLARILRDQIAKQQDTETHDGKRHVTPCLPLAKDVDYKDTAKLSEAVVSHLLLQYRPEQRNRVLDAFTWLGLLSCDEIVGPSCKSPMDALCEVMMDKMAYGADERDMVLMSHEIKCLYPNGVREEKLSTLVMYGDSSPGGHSALAKSVGVPVAIASLLILDGTIDRKGVCGPTDKNVYTPILRALEEEGIDFVESNRVLYG